jgi:HAD superfamily hydrolase (TIGR01509 family)
MELEGVIFDFDGIVIDSEPLHFQAFLDMLEPFGLSFTWGEYQDIFIGMDDRDAFNTVFADSEHVLSDAERDALILRKAEHFPTLIEERGAPVYEGVVDLIRASAAAGRLGLSSGALRTDLEPVLHKLEIYDLFETIVTADDVAKSKPDPESYRLCLERLGAKDPARWFAIEDTCAGIASAKGAGMKVLAVTNSYPADKLGEADVIVDSLVNVNPEVLTSWL